VKVENGLISRTYEAKGEWSMMEHSLRASQVGGDIPALQAAQNYAAQHAVAYDHVRALLRVTSASQTLRWRVQLINDSASKGFVFVNESDGSFALIRPGSVHSHASASTGGGVRRRCETSC